MEDVQNDINDLKKRLNQSINELIASENDVYLQPIRYDLECSSQRL